MREPRAVLHEFGVAIDDDVEVRAWDSISERRYLVVPERPAGTEADASAKGEIRREPLYTVAFSASALWPEGSHVKDRVYVELWESYLEPAS